MAAWKTTSEDILEGNDMRIVGPGDPITLSELKTMGINLSWQRYFHPFAWGARSAAGR